MSVLICHFGAEGRFGLAGVFTFFVLSGFLITGILLRLREESPTVRGASRFYVRRALRIFPLYYGVLTLGVLIGLPGVQNHLLWHLGYASNLGRGILRDGFGAVGHFWSLAVEEQFYLFWPWAVLFLPQRWLAPTILAGVVSGVLSRTVLILLTGENEPTDHFIWLNITTSALDQLGLGALLAYCRHYGWGLRPLRRWSMLGAVFCLPILVVSPSAKLGVPVVDYGLGWFVAGLGFLWLVDRAADGRTPFLGWPPARYIGKISYGLYVLHHPIMWFAGPVVGGEPSVPRFFVLSALSIGLAALSWHLFEAPINALKHRVPYLDAGYRWRARSQVPSG